MAAKVLILAGDAAESLEVLYPYQRLREEGYEVHIAAPSKKKLQFVVHDFVEGYDTYTEKPGYTWPADLAFREVDPAQYAALVIPGGRGTRADGCRCGSAHPLAGRAFRRRAATRGDRPRTGHEAASRPRGRTHRLDSQTGRAILDVLLQLNTQRGLTVIMVTHNAFAATYGQRTLELRDGRIVRDVHADSEPSHRGPVPLHR